MSEWPDRLPHVPRRGHPQERLQNCTAPRLFVGSVAPPQSRFIFPSSVLCPASEDPRAGAEGSTYARASPLLSPELCPRGTSQSLTSAWPWPFCCYFFPQRPVIAGSILGFSEPVFPAGHGPACPAPSARLEKGRTCVKCALRCAHMTERPASPACQS